MNATVDKAPKQFPKATARIVHVLRLLSEIEGGANLSRLCELTSVPKTSLLTLLGALVENGYLRNEQGIYSLGLEAFKLASAIVSRRRFPSIALPLIETLAIETGETVLIAEFTQDRSQIAYVAKADSPRDVRYTVAIGDRRPLYSASGGRVLLAFAPNSEQHAYLENEELSFQASVAVTSKAMLRSVLARVVDTQMDDADLHSTNEVCGLAMPIRDSRNDVVAALVVAGPHNRMRADLDNIKERLRAASAEISTLLGGRDSAAT